MTAELPPVPLPKQPKLPFPQQLIVPPESKAQLKSSPPATAVAVLILLTVTGVVLLLLITVGIVVPAVAHVNWIVWVFGEVML